ncbi:MAG: Cache 3/Cache 2 fusion domain-containing protein [Gammaproteobacteria bacterium]|nr:Cache 3/Cache 2 fusion domain-containing protein [Gammaproteobacteria bacterium]
MIKDFKVSLKVSVLGLFLTLFIATILTIVLITSFRFYRSQMVISDQQMETVAREVQRELIGVLHPAEQSSNLAVKLIGSNTVDLNTTAEMEDFSLELLKTIPNAAMVYWGDTQGNFIVSRRESDNTISSEIINRGATPPTDNYIYRDRSEKVIKIVAQPKITYDPRSRPWYQDAVNKKAFIWSKAYVFFSGAGKTLGVTAAQPVYKNNVLQGVVGIDMKLKSLSEFLKTQVIGKTGVAYIIGASGNLIAHPSLVNIQNNKDAQLSSVKELPSWQEKAFDEFQKSGKEKFIFYDKKLSYLASIKNIPGFQDKLWRIVVVVPEDDFVGELKNANIMTIKICALILFFGIILITFYSRQISKSLGKLVAVTGKIREFDLAETPPIDTHIHEISYLCEAIYSMRTGLRSFQKYVPADLVRILVHKGMGDQIGGSRKDITIFFSDIKSFTTIAEKIPPEELMQHLCDYFDVVSTIIRENLGNIDKYIGDAVMAFWNSPLPDDKHCYHACISALQFQHKLKQLNKVWKESGRPEFPTRIGIHTGDAIVGNLGSSTRVNYTAIGDNINLASRLENINRIYGTKIIVSDSVVAVVNDFFVFRILDSITVKGQAVHHKIYELICERTSTTDSSILNYVKLYDDAFNAYQQQRWEDAINLLNELLKEHSDDKAAKVLLERCKRFKRNPPPADWDGVWRYTTKD